MTNIVRICDTTLRDGEQAPGFSMNPREKLRLAVQLERLGVDRIEAGFASASEGEFAAIERIARTLKLAEIMSFARANPNDIETSARALEKANRPVIHTFISTSDIHLKHKLGWSRQEALDKGGEAVRQAMRLVGTVQFAMEDASRSDPEFVLEAVKVGLEAGATTINIADTVGYILPHEWADLVRKIMAVPGMDKAVLSVHGHDDLGLAVANALAAVEAGARQVECTINGIGERAGNTSMEELVMILKTRDVNGLVTNIDAREFCRTSRLLCAVTGSRVPPNKAIVGKNAFAHEAGIHQAGILKNPLTYEIMTPESVGMDGRTFVLGKHSGRQGLAARLEQVGLALSKEELDAAYVRFCVVADAKKVVEDEDLIGIVDAAADARPTTYQLETLECTSGHGNCARATVVLSRDGESSTGASVGREPFDACARAINRIVGPFRIEEVEMTSNRQGEDCTASVTARITDGGGQCYVGKSNSSDVVLASAHAYLNAVNQSLLREQYRGVRKPARQHAGPLQCDGDTIRAVGIEAQQPAIR